MYYSDYSSCEPEKEAETAYSDYVSTLPAQGYDSAGTLLWQPNWSDAVDNKIGFAVRYGSSSGKDAISSGGSALFTKDSLLDGYSADVYGKGLSLYRDEATSSARLSVARSGSAVFTVPITGTYRMLQTRFCNARLENGRDTNFYDKQFFYWHSAGSFTLGAGGSCSFWPNFLLSDESSNSVSSFSVETFRATLTFVTPVFEVTPADISITNNYYISTRVNNFNGDYYDSVTNNYYNNTTIVNETTNNYYDITTNNNYTMSNWSYDYASRTYFITLDDGTTVTVQFGDDCMTITKNDVTNSYQYVIKNNGGSDPDTPTTCKHDWQETIDTAPTCLEGGHASYTCSLCGETYEQILSAKGHDWQVIEHVNMVYNSDGTVATQGHTLYQFSVCGEQWYTDTGAPPPDVSGSSTIIAWLTNFQTWLDGKFGLFVDKLQVVVDNSETNIENTIIDITNDNDAFNVFYIEDGDGNTQSVTDFAGDLTGASGKLLSLLYRLVFADALSGVDDDLDSFEDFFTSQEPVTDTAAQSMDDTANEVIDVWAS